MQHNMADIWRDSTVSMSPRGRRTLFVSTGKSQDPLQRNHRPLLNPREKQRGLWSMFSLETTESTHVNASHIRKWTPDVSRATESRSESKHVRHEPMNIVSNDRSLILRISDDYSTAAPVVPEITSPPIVDDDCSEPYVAQEVPISEGLTVQAVDEHVPPLTFKDDLSALPTRDITDVPGHSSDRLQSLNEFEMPREGGLTDAADFVTSIVGNPFDIFRLRHARSAVKVTEDELSRLKTVMLSRRHSPDELLTWFKASISVTNVPMMRTILQFLCDIILCDVNYRPLCVRMMETALVYHPDELVQSFSCAHIIPLFEPEVNDDIGGSFVRLFLSYKATFTAPGIAEDGVPIGLDTHGVFRYSIDECDAGDKARLRQPESSVLENGLNTASVSSVADSSAVFPNVTSAHEFMNSIGCGKIESMILLKICADRAGVSSAFGIPASRLRDWLCTIWFELPATRPCLPLMQLCIHWIDSREDPSFLKDAAFALLQKERDLFGTFEGDRLLMIELLSFMLRKNGDVSVELSKIVDMMSDSEEDTLYAVIDSIITHNFREKDMLDFWCLLCILPWPVSSPSSVICRLISSTFLVYYKLAYASLRGSVDDRFISSPMGVLENALRICMCRAASPILAKSALLQAILLVDISPLPALQMTNAPLLLASLCPFLWKCHFIWSSCGRDVDADNVVALRYLYHLLRSCVLCEPLSGKCNDLSTRNAPMFPRVRFASDDQPFEDVSHFIPSMIDAEVANYKFHPENSASYESSDIAVDLVKPLDPPRGLRNLGNSCYYNSMLQALFHTRYFVHSVLGFSGGGSALGIYKKLFRKMLKRGKKPFDPTIGYKLFPSEWRHRSQQQDVTEALNYVLEILDVTRGLWKRVFAGMVLRRIRCLHCESLSDNREVAMDFTFPLAGLPSIQEMFDDYCKIETLSKDNRYFCSKCNAYRKAHMWNVITSPPSHLIVILSRQIWLDESSEGRHKGGASKQLEHVKIDVNLSICQFDYTLYGAIIHSGESTTSGHYYFVGRDSEANSRWHVCDDSQVLPATSSTINDISQDRTNSHVPYVLFYRCVQAPATPL